MGGFFLECPVLGRAVGGVAGGAQAGGGNANGFFAGVGLGREIGVVGVAGVVVDEVDVLGLHAQVFDHRVLAGLVHQFAPLFPGSGLQEAVIVRAVRLRGEARVLLQAVVIIRRLAFQQYRAPVFAHLFDVVGDLVPGYAVYLHLLRVHVLAGEGHVVYLGRFYARYFKDGVYGLAGIAGLVLDPRVPLFRGAGQRHAVSHYGSRRVVIFVNTQNYHRLSSSRSAGGNPPLFCLKSLKPAPLAFIYIIIVFLAGGLLPPPQKAAPRAEGPGARLRFVSLNFS